jgi:hypothetical protein
MINKNNKNNKKMERRLENYRLNIWDALTMIPILICAFIVNSSLLSYAFIFMGIIGFIHHLFVNNYRFLVLDFISIAVLTTTFTIVSTLPQYIKDIIYFLEFSVIVFLIFCLISNIKYSLHVFQILFSLIWLPNAIFSIKYISNASGWISLVTVFLYMSSVTLCGKNTFIRFSWPALHVGVAIVAFFVLYEMDLLRPEIYKPFEPILERITENLISS